MTELDYLKMKLEDKEKAFDKLFKRHMDLLKQQGELEKENEQLTPFLNIARDYNLTLDQLYGVLEETLESD